MAYKSNQSLAKGLSLLSELNTLGRAKPADLGRRCGIDRTTAYRLLETLEGLGYVARSASDGSYVLAVRVRELSDGLTVYDRVSRIVGEEFATLLPQVQWPSDLAVFDRGWMVIRESTHRFSPYSVHRQMVGKRRPLLDSALGRSVMAASSEEESLRLLDIAMAQQALDEPYSLARERTMRLREDFARRGYAWSVGGSDPRISAISLPVTTGTGVPAAVNVLFFTSALTVEEAAQRFLGSLRACVKRIELRLAQDEGD